MDETPERAFGLTPSLTLRRGRRKLFTVGASPRMRRVVFVYAVLSALVDLVVLLPGNPAFSSGWGLVGSVVIQSLVVWRLARGSVLAWALGVLMGLGGVASVLLVGLPIGATEALLAVVCLAQAGILLTPPVLAWPQRRTPPASA